MGILFKDEFYKQTQTLESNPQFYNIPTLSHRSILIQLEFFSAEDDTYATLSNTIAPPERRELPKVMN